MQEIRVRVGQIDLQVRDYPHKGDAIIFLHFSGANLMMWQRAIPHFRDRYRLILVDLRGHGRSDQPETGYHIDDMARDVVGIMRHLQLERAHVVGSSLGAEVGLSMAANYPDLVISLVCDGALSSEYGPYGTWEGSEAEYQQDVARQMEKLRSASDTVYPSVDALLEDRRQILEKYGYWNEVAEAVERHGARQVGEGQFARAFGRRAQADYMEHYFQCRFEDYYKRATCPLLMLAGKDLLENEREKAAMEGLKGLAAQAQIVLIDGWDHPYGWLLDPADACQAMVKFLDDTVH